MKLKTYLTQNNLTEAEFGEKAGLSQAAVNRYCAGKRIPDKDAMPAIIAATGGAVQPNDFFDIAPSIAQHEPALKKTRSAQPTRNSNASPASSAKSLKGLKKTNEARL